jgi:hypothetical protein
VRISFPPHRALAFSTPENYGHALPIQYFEKILNKSSKRPLFLYSAIRRSVCFTPPKITIAMTPTITVAVPRSFAAERMADQFMLAMLPHSRKVTVPLLYPFRESWGAPYLARFSRDVGDHGNLRASLYG